MLRPRVRISVRKLLLALPLLAIGTTPTKSTHAQTIEDATMVGAQELRTGVSYAYDSWDKYWEGTLKRGNGNIGTITTRTVAWNSTYGVTERLNLFATVPYVWTHASQGVLHDMEGFQDLTLASKYRLIETPFTTFGSLRAFAALAASLPLTDYTPEFLPLSIGSASKRVSGRLTLNFMANSGWFTTGSAAYTWREKVELDRPYYYTNGQLYQTNEVQMPDVLDYSLTTGYMRGEIMASVFFAQQRTQGGDDIRRQDMPFVSNRMNFSKAGVMLQYPMPWARNLDLQFSYSYTTDGRNVGKASTANAALLYRFDFDRKSQR